MILFAGLGPPGPASLATALSRLFFRDEKLCCPQLAGGGWAPSLGIADPVVFTTVNGAFKEGVKDVLIWALSLATWTCACFGRRDALRATSGPSEAESARWCEATLVLIHLITLTMAIAQRSGAVVLELPVLTRPPVLWTDECFRDWVARYGLDILEIRYERGGDLCAFQHERFDEVKPAGRELEEVFMWGRIHIVTQIKYMAKCFQWLQCL